MADQTTLMHWENLYIFISSTFNDMHAERDYLVKNVFPRLRDWCEKRRLRLIDIDLRWGVTESDATSQNVVRVCLNRIDQCRPFFICFTGQRYGWVPKKENISEETFDTYKELGSFIDEGRSVTDLEVQHAVLNPLRRQKEGEEVEYDPAEHAFFYFRDPSYLSDLPSDQPYVQRTYTDKVEKDEIKKQILRQKHGEFKLDIIHRSRRSIRYYETRWQPDAKTLELALPLGCPAAWPENQQRWREAWSEYAGIPIPVQGLEIVEGTPEAHQAHTFNESITSGRLGNFTCNGQALENVIFEDLTKAMELRYPEHREIEYEHDLQKELDQQDQFQRLLTEGFIKRQEDFNRLNAYVSGNSNRLFVLTGPSGIGKSSLLAKWAEDFQVNSKDATVHTRFIGGSDRSTSAQDLIYFLLQELQIVHNKLPEARQAKSERDLMPFVIPTEETELLKKWPDLLKDAGTHGKTIILIDGLNQLQTGLKNLSWIPTRLPGNIKFIISFRTDTEEGSALKSVYEEQAEIHEMRPFSQHQDRIQLIETYLSQYLKDIDTNIREIIANLPGSENPLYLRIVLSELRIFGAFANLKDKIQSDFGNTPQSAFQSLLNRLIADPAYSPLAPVFAVPALFGLLAYTRRGLSVQDLATLIRRINNSTGDDRIYRAAIALYLRQVRPYTIRRDENNDFLYEAFKLAAKDTVQNLETKRLPQLPQEARQWHHRIAGYFDELWQDQHLHALQELPYHTTLTHDQEAIRDLLCNLKFLESKIAACSVYELQEDYRFALDEAHINWITDIHTGIEDFQKLITQEHRCLSRYPHLTFQQSANQNPDSYPAAVAKRDWERGVESRPWIWRQTSTQNRGISIPLSFSIAAASQTFAEKPAWIIGISRKGELEILNALSGEKLVSRAIENRKWRHISSTPDGQHLILANRQSEIYHWALNGPNKLSEIGVSQSTDSYIIDGYLFIYKSKLQMLCTYDLRTNNQRTEISIPCGSRLFACYDRTKLLAESSDSDSDAALIDLNNNTILAYIEHNHRIVCGGLSQSGQLAVTASVDSVVHLTEVATNRQIAKIDLRDLFPRHKLGIPSCCLLIESAYTLYIGTDTGLVFGWNWQKNRAFGPLGSHGQEVTTLSDLGQNRIYIGFRNSGITTSMDLADPGIDGPQPHISGNLNYHDDTWIIAAGQNSLYRAQRPTGHPVEHICTLQNRITSFCKLDHRRYGIGDHFGNLAIVDIWTGEFIDRFRIFSTSVRGVLALSEKHMLAATYTTVAVSPVVQLLHFDEDSEVNKPVFKTGWRGPIILRLCKNDTAICKYEDAIGNHMISAINGRTGDDHLLWQGLCTDLAYHSETDKLAIAGETLAVYQCDGHDLTLKATHPEHHRKCRWTANGKMIVAENAEGIRFYQAEDLKEIAHMPLDRRFTDYDIDDYNIVAGTHNGEIENLKMIEGGEQWPI